MKITRFTKWMLIVIATALVMFLVVGLILFFFPGNSRHRSSRSVSEYENFVEYDPLASLIFPDVSLLSEDNCVFYDEYCFDGSNTPRYLTYALCSFSEEIFDQEVSRLAKLASEYSEAYFYKPAYILFLNYVGMSEYALVNEENHTIHYISYSSNRFYDRLPAEDRIKSAYADLDVPFRDLALFNDRYGK